MERGLTPFQKTCIKELEHSLAALGRNLTAQRLAGEHETYLLARVSDTSIEVCIYEDEATFSAPHGGRMYERLDYPSPEELIRAFVNGVLGCLSKATTG
jgi:hypothetical protein